MKEIAYRCAQDDPKIILAQGFKATEKGYTEANAVKHLYDEYLPNNPMFDLSFKAKV